MSPEVVPLGDRTAQTTLSGHPQLCWAGGGLSNSSEGQGLGKGRRMSAKRRWRPRTQPLPQWKSPNDNAAFNEGFLSSWPNSFKYFQLYVWGKTLWKCSNSSSCSHEGTKCRPCFIHSSCLRTPNLAQAAEPWPHLPTQRPGLWREEHSEETCSLAAGGSGTLKTLGPVQG